MGKEKYLEYCPTCGEKLYLMRVGWEPNKGDVEELVCFAKRCNWRESDIWAVNV